MSFGRVSRWTANAAALAVAALVASGVGSIRHHP